MTRLSPAPLRFFLIVFFVAVGAGFGLRSALAATEVHTGSGTRLMVVEGLEVRVAPGGTRLLFIDENTIRTGPGAPHVLYLDGDDLRAEPGGPRVACFEGDTLRRSPGGNVLLVISDKEIRKETGGPVALKLVGDALSRPQLAAALYQWNPSLFKLTPAELQKAQEEMNSAASASATAARAKLLGKFTIINSNLTFLAKGTAEIAKQGDYYSVNMDFGNGQKWSGVAVARTAFKEEELWTALGPTNSTMLGVYEAIDAEHVKADWFPQAALTQGAAMLGSESADGAGHFNGNYTITAGKHVMNKGTYTGSIRMSVFPTPNNDSFKPRLLEYQIGSARVTGIGAIIPYGVERQSLVAAVSTDKIFAVGRISEVPDVGVQIDFCTNTKVAGYIRLDKQ